MALPVPTFLGQVYTDTASGRSWVCVSLTPPVWAVNKNVLLSIQGGLSVTGGASIAGGIIASGGLSVTGGATITGGVALYGNVTVNGSAISLSGAVGGSGIANVPLASASVTGVASFGNQFVVSALGAVSLTSNYVSSVNGMTGSVTLTLAGSVPVASSSATGVASFGNEFVVSALGAVGLTSNYVISVNGRTGNVGLPLASSSATGVASFGSDFVVSALGAVSITSNNVTTVNGKTGNVGLPLASSSATGVASFGNEFTVSALGAVGLTSNYVISVNGKTGNVGLPLASSSATGIASFGSEFTVSAAGAVGLTSNYVISVNGRTGNVGLPLASSSATGVASFGNEFVVSALGAVGLTSNYVISINGITGTVTGIAITGSNTFLGLQTLNAGLTTNHVYVSNGATFANGLVVQAGGLNVSSGTISGTLATAAQTNITSVGTLTRLEVGSGGISSTGGITGTLNTAAQPNITSVGTLTSLSSSGLVTASGGITSNHLYVTNGVTFAGTSVHTGLGTFNAGLTTTHLHVTNGVTFAGTSVHTGLGTFNAGITSTHLYVSNGATFANGLTILGVGGYQSISSDASNNLNVNSWNYQSYKVGGTEKLYIGAAGISATGLYVSTGATFAGTNGIFLAMNASNPLGTTGSSLVSDSTAAGALRITTPSGYVTIGPFNTSYSHFVTDRTTYYFNRPLQINQTSGQPTIGSYTDTDPFIIGTPNVGNGTLISRITVLTGPDAVTGGYVGIGTTTPRAKLDVNGNTIVRGSVSITGGLSVTGGVTLQDGLVVQTGGMSVQGMATFASSINALQGMSVTGGTAYFYGDVYLATGANHPGIVDYEFAANTGVTYPSASTPNYTVGDKWSNGSIEYTWNGSAWIENTDNIVSSSPIAFDSLVPSQSITPSKLSLGGPSWNESGTTINGSLLIRNSFGISFEAPLQFFPPLTPAGLITTSSNNRLDIIAGNQPNYPTTSFNSGIRLTGLTGFSTSGPAPKVEIAGNLHIVAPRETGYGQGGTGNIWINGNLQCTGNAFIGGTSLLVGNVSIGGNVTTSGNIVASGSAHDLNGYPILQNVVGEMAFIVANPQSYVETICGIYPLVTSTTTTTAAPSGGKAAANATLALGSNGTFVYNSFGGTTTWSKNSSPYGLRPSQGSWTLLVTPTGANYYTIVAIRIA